ncbi:class I SAM-dependent methyltransferase [Alkalilimnicola ehrlichii MLHE-1]|uniref:Ribosomal RNA small subunit methyltransferase J n=1 Tax=Alkalilimnicola ehrlichii (strain ATCC BAA-1101 / DSM 17681 / MLHE-1) TaxID=187272 RepID=RSMJ_ALKEH|nr:class I SAM-dependent methyltransferase [Alkalilimnicola ehrlichii]Q0A6F5.1 RecName: Full=Ribosomal RNA small subunit methyltransferase J; AltName: Full=16S rRNA m2G1516 methyltransferase; AltName: Full=rRNA (guanine-N(2)-)-methyltransferase [Alkalilimnicola ehrlichii MLHE-1]ABI57582.1 protein of unknown function DUF548 [Alkalilimnicola ehrlichii MLHE-1]
MINRNHRPLRGVLSDPDEPAAAAALAHRLDLPLLTEPPETPALFLHHSRNGLALRSSGSNAPGPIRVSLDEGRQGQRLRQASLKRETLARACGLRGGRSLRIVDATAGLGRDAMVLAALGARVTLIERHPVIAALLADGLRRARRSHPELAARLHLVEADSLQWLAELTPAERPEVICLDPMYPAGSTRGAVRKDLQALRELPDWPGLAPVDEVALLALARASATARVVVKRPGRAAPLAGKAPDWQLPGRSTRFDVYRGLAGD